MPIDLNRRSAAQRSTRCLGLIATGTAATLALAGCASGEPALEDVWPEVNESIQNASSVAIEGSVTQGGQDVAVAISGHIDDSSYSGSVAMGESDVEIVGNGQYTYMKPNAAFYEQMGGAPLQELVGEKWLRMPAEEGGFTMSTFWDSFTEEIPDAEQFGESDYTSETVDLDGEEVYKYTGTDADSGKPVSVYLSKDNRLVRVEAQQDEPGDGQPTEDSTEAAAETGSASASPEGGATGTVDFSDWDAVEPVEMPAEDEVFSIPGT